jgi:hypothetical protein
MGSVKLAVDQMCQHSDYNAGVQFATPCVLSIALYRKTLLDSVLTNRILPKGQAQDVSPYEQGHVRWAARDCPIVRESSPRWNWTSQDKAEVLCWHARFPGMWEMKLSLKTPYREHKLKYLPRSWYLYRAMMFLKKDMLYEKS